MNRDVLFGAAAALAGVAAGVLLYQRSLPSTPESRLSSSLISKLGIGDDIVRAAMPYVTAALVGAGGAALLVASWRAHGTR